MTKGVRTLLPISILALILPATVVSVPRDWAGNRTKDTVLESTYSNSDLSVAEDYSTTEASSGDTVVLFCDDERFSLGPVGTDCWGWTAPDGRDYAMMGTNYGLVFVNVTDTEVAGTVIGPDLGCSGAYWRDIKTYQHYCYCVSECGGTNEGMMVIDMQYLPDSVHFIKSVDPNPAYGYPYSHNLSIDTIKGFAYAESLPNDGLSIMIWDLADPADPQFVSSFGLGGNGGIHDIHANNDTVFVAEGYNGTFSIYNMANKQSPQLITRVPIPFAGFVHNIWPGKNGNYCATTEETPGKTVKIWDIHDLNNIQLVGEYLGGSLLAHNAHFSNDTIYLSHYESGVSIVDASNPASPSLIANFDTYPGAEDPDFAGCWGVFPHTPDGRIYGSNMDGQLFVFSCKQAILADTLAGDTVVGEPGTQIRVDVNAHNTIPIRKFTVPFTWTGPLNMSFDSASTSGLRTEYFEIQSLAGFDPFNSRAAYSMTSTTGTNVPDLAPGDGPILSLYFTIPSGAPSGVNYVQFKPYSSFVPRFSHKCLPYLPDTVAAAVISGNITCCVGSRGNVNGDPLESIDISDLTELVTYMFKNGADPTCLEEANINGTGEIDVSDLTFLTNYMFKHGPYPPACP